MAQNNTPIRALVLAGGGARGSYQVGVCRALTGRVPSEEMET